MTPGMDPSVMDINGVGAGCLICFDSIYESLAMDSVRAGAELFLLSTNDSWFYDSVAISMHNDQARLRSIETGRCTLRAANTGVSTVITYSGDVTRELKPLVEGYVVGEVSASTHRTLYSYVGNAFIYLSAAALAGYFIFEAVREKKERSEGKKSGTEG
jgi:apolipoprotein N-acyltransferase